MIVVVHRLSTVAHAGRIAVIEHGRMAESGTHAELLTCGGVYASLWHVQTGGVIVRST